MSSCGDCGATIADLDGPRHPYLSAAPGCWALFASLEDWKTALVANGDVDLAQDLVDAYAAQHPTNTDRRNRQSVAVHLMSLCAAIDTGITGTERRESISRWTHRDYPPLMPPPSGFEITASDVAAAPNQRRSAMVRLMAATTWAAWSDHHPTIRNWLRPGCAPQAAIH